MQKKMLSNEQVLAILNAPAKRTQDHSTTPDVLDSVLASLRTVNYETEHGVQSFEVESFKGVRISKKTGKEIATFVVKGGEYRSLFTAQIQF
jgi:hypothetical protein